MAIIIPSKNIYGKQNPKVRDNVIERIEVGAVEVVRDNDYNTPVYNGVFPQVDTVIENKSGDEDYEAETSYAYEIWSADVAYISYINQKFFNKNIYIKKTQNNHFVQSIILGQNEEGQNNIKHAVYGYTQSGVATAEWEGKYKATGIQGTLNLNIGTINFGKPTVNNKIVAFNLFEEYTFTWENDIPTDSTTVSVSRTAQDYSNLGEIDFSEEEIDGEEYYKLSLSVMCGYRRVTMGAYNYGNTYTEEGKERTFSMKGDYIDYIPTQIEITIYGNSIGIDLVDKTVYINGETAKKVHRIDGNELIQTITEKQIELKQLNKGTDYVWEYYIDPISGGAVYSRAELYIYNNDLIGAVVVVSIDGSGGVLNKEFEVPSNKTIGIDNGGYPIDDISSVSVKVLKEINNIDSIFNKIALAYKNGKETATIRCSISDYFDSETMEKVVSVDNSTDKMVFNLYDKVVPMVRTSDGIDIPMSTTIGETGQVGKVFSVLGTKIFYDGAVWQELSLQETTETIELPEEQVQLITPIVTISGDILTISNVDANTQSYTLYVDNLRTATFYDTTFDLSTLNLAVGEYSISVVATTTADNYKDSEKSISVIYFVEKVVETLKTPVIAIDGDILTVSQADERTEIFAIFVDGVEKGMTTEYSFDLSALDLAEGGYQITVIARAEWYTESHESNEVTYVVIAEEEEKTLSAPTITLNGNALTIKATDDRTEEFVILVDDVEFPKVTPDLTNSTWNVPSGWTATAGYGTFYINYDIRYDLPDSTASVGTELYIGYSLADTESGKPGGYEESEPSENCILGTSGLPFTNDNGLIFTFEGGLDIANDRLIDWLKSNNAEHISGVGATVDLSSLGLSAGTHEITVKAIASGCSDSNPSNEVSYSLIGVSGAWYFDEHTNFGSIDWNVSFTSNGKQYNRVYGFYPALYYDNDTVYLEDPFGDGWTDEAYRTITFDGVQIVREDFYDWLVDNAVQTYTVSGTRTFNETLDVSKAMSVECEFWVAYILGPHLYKKIEIKDNALYYCTADNSVQVYSVVDGWKVEEYRKIVFVTPQTVNKEFYEWLVANATKDE